MVRALLFLKVNSLFKFDVGLVKVISVDEIKVLCFQIIGIKSQVQWLLCCILSLQSVD